jgi:hypothetical protein
MTFPQIVETLMREGYGGYMIDFRRVRVEGDRIEFDIHKIDAPIALVFDVSVLKTTIKEAQRLVATWVSVTKLLLQAARLCGLQGRRARYFGRIAEAHVEHFPQEGGPSSAK